MKKIGFFVIATQMGGAEKSLLHFLKDAVKNSELEIQVIVPKEHGPLIDQLREAKIQVDVFPISPLLLKMSRKNKLQFLLLALPGFFLTLTTLIRLQHFLKKKKFSGLHSTGLKFHILLGLICKWSDIPLCLHIRDIFSHKKLLKLFQYLNQAPKTLFVANSKATAKSLLPIPSEVIYNGFSPQSFSPAPNAFLSQHFGLPKDAFIVGIVGVIARWKGQREFLEMAKTLASANASLYFVIVGSEIYDTSGEKGELAQLKKRVQQWDLEGRVHFLPFHQKIAEVYNSLNILVHASIKPEPFGRVLVEALLCGTPVVASNQGGPLEIIESGKNGLLFKQGDVVDLSKNVGLLISNPELYSQFQKNGPQIARKFSSERTHKALLETLLTL